MSRTRPVLIGLLVVAVAVGIFFAAKAIFGGDDEDGRAGLLGRGRRHARRA